MKLDHMFSNPYASLFTIDMYHRDDESVHILYKDEVHQIINYIVVSSKFEENLMFNATSPINKHLSFMIIMVGVKTLKEALEMLEEQIKGLFDLMTTEAVYRDADGNQMLYRIRYKTPTIGMVAIDHGIKIKYYKKVEKFAKGLEDFINDIYPIKARVALHTLRFHKMRKNYSTSAIYCILYDDFNKIIEKFNEKSPVKADEIYSNICINSIYSITASTPPDNGFCDSWEGCF